MPDPPGRKPGRWDPLPPVLPWEVPTAAVTLVAGALASGRPGGLSAPRLNGLPDEDVGDRYRRLRAAVLRHAVAAGSDLARFDALERSEPEAPATRWQTWVATSGACDDPEVVRVARDLWEALGPNEYARCVRRRPRTARGAAEARLWLVAATAPTLMALMVSVGGPGSALVRSLLAGAAVSWTAFVAAAFAQRRRRLDRIGGAELPHL